MLNSIKLAHVLFGQKGTDPILMVDIIVWLEQMKGQKG